MLVGDIGGTAMLSGLLLTLSLSDALFEHAVKEIAIMQSNEKHQILNFIVITYCSDNSTTSVNHMELSCGLHLLCRTI